MSDPAKKVKKVKEPVELDYSKLPDHIWEKHLKEFTDLMNDIDVRLAWCERAMDRLSRTINK